MAQKSESLPYSIRLPEEVVDRLEHERERRQAAEPGYHLTVSDVIRSLILKGLSGE